MAEVDNYIPSLTLSVEQRADSVRITEAQQLELPHQFNTSFRVRFLEKLLFAPDAFLFHLLQHLFGNDWLELFNLWNDNFFNFPRSFLALEGV